jgi:hypothetical protein
VKDLIAALAAHHPEHAGTLQAISAIADAVDSLPFEPFFEPVSTVLVHRRERQYLSISAGHIAAWANHVAYACRVRMRAIEAPILREIHDGHLTASATLLRAHLETAGLAAHSFLTVTDSAKSGDKKPLDDLMRKTLFGTALFKETKRVPELEQYLDLSDQCTASASELVDGLDRFLEPNTPVGNRQRLRYALLCEYGHPNLRGFKGFSHLVRETEDGWFVQYTAEEDRGAYGVQMIVEYLLEDMRLGYSACEFLRRTTFVDEGDRLQCCPPDPVDVAWIESAIMRLS